jgi:hypothetical protein
LGEKVKDKDFSHKFLMCLPKRFKTLRTIIFRDGLKDVSPNEVLGDVMTKEQYNSEGEEIVKKEDKKKSGIQGRYFILQRTRARTRLRRKNQVMKNAPMMIVMMKH